MGQRRVWAVMKSGDRWEGDILVGADGIYSKASCHRKCATSYDSALLEYHCTVWSAMKSFA